MGAFLDKIFGSKIEVDMAKIDLEAELSFQDCRMNGFLAKQVLKGQVSADIVDRYHTFLDKMALLENTKAIPVSQELQLLSDYVSLYQDSAEEETFIRLDIKLECDKPVLPLLSFPLVLNAIQQGYNTMDKYPLKVRIHAFEHLFAIEISNRVNHHIVSQENTSLLGRYKNRLLSLFPDNYMLLFNSNSNTFKSNLQIKW